MIVDTHTHLYLPEFEGVAEVAVVRAIKSGVEHMIFPNVDLTTIEPMLELHDRFERNTSVAMGLHPTEVKGDWQEVLDKVECELKSGRKYVAVGEIGIDLYWDKTYKTEQLYAFARQIEWANELDLPIIIHCREGLDEVLDVLDGINVMPRGVFHSFGGTIEDVERIRKRGDFYFGINGIVTFKNCHLRDVLPEIGIERMILETDSPYLSPVPHRGKRNESAYIIHTAAHIAASIGMALSDVERVTTGNAMSLFSLEL